MIRGQSKSKPGLVIIMVALIVSSFLGCSKLKSMVEAPTNNNMSKQGSALHPGAVAGFVSSVRPYQESVESIFRRARYFQENRKYRLAIQELHAVVYIDPNHVQAFNSMGVCYDFLGDYERAVNCYKKALAVNHDLAYVQNNLGYSYFLQGRLDAAVEAFKKAIDLNAQEAIYHNNLGLAYAQRGQIGMAFQELALGGGEAMAHYNLAQILSGKGLDAEARANLDQIQSTIQPRPKSNPLAANTAASDEPHHYKTEDVASDFAAASHNQKISSPSGVISQMHNLPAKKSIEVLSSTGIEHSHFEAQVALCRSSANAEEIQQSIVALGYLTVISEKAGQDKRYVVRTGPFNDLNQTESAAQELALINGGQPGSVKETAERVGAATLYKPYGGEKEEVMSSGSKNGNKRTTGDEPAAIEVSNGNGARFMARDVSRYLGKRGSKVQKLTNAESFSHEKTTIYYCDGYLVHAYRIAEELPGLKELQKVQRLRNRDIKIRLVIGKDLVTFREPFDNV